MPFCWMWSRQRPCIVHFAVYLAFRPEAILECFGCHATVQRALNAAVPLVLCLVPCPV